MSDRDSLVIWWERSCNQARAQQTKPYPLPWDGAGHAIMCNFFAVVGYGDERHGTKEQLGTMMYIARPIIVQRFLELWPTVKPAWKGEDESTP